MKSVAKRQEASERASYSGERAIESSQVKRHGKFFFDFFPTFFLFESDCERKPKNK